MFVLCFWTAAQRLRACDLAYEGLVKGLFNDSVETVPVHLLLTNALVRLQHDNGLPSEMRNTKTKSEK